MFVNGAGGGGVGVDKTRGCQLYALHFVLALCSCSENYSIKTGEKKLKIEELHHRDAILESLTVEQVSYE